jgi:cytochrome c-type biogenesis protein CcmH/NrfG
MVFLGAGIGVGYLGRGIIRESAPVQTGARAGTSPADNAGQQQMPSLEQLKRMADKQAEPLLEQLKTQPNDAAVLAEVAHTYVLAHQFKEALPYYERSVRADPKNVGVRADFASCLFYSGEADKAVATLEEALRYEPNNAQALFNLGMIRWKALGDTAGAIALWQRLLKTNPNLPDVRRQAVESAIAEARQQGKSVAR